MADQSSTSSSADNDTTPKQSTSPPTTPSASGDKPAIATGSNRLCDAPPAAPIKYEYLDHTADVQLHAWGDDLPEAFEQVAVSMFGYMTDIETVTPTYSYDIDAQGDGDMLSLMFHFLDEWLFAFSAEPFFIPRSVKILEFDREAFRIKARGWGESFDLKKHPQGTEVKAITYSAMQVHDTDTTHEVFVIIDI